jgi:hypothetical protein
MDTFSIPIKLSDSFEGFAESKGLLLLKNGAIIIQFQTKDAILGMVKSDLKNVDIPLENLIEISYKKSIFGNKLILLVDNLSFVELLPSSDSNEIVLSIARKDIDTAIDLVRALKLDQSEKEYQAALKEVD